MTLPSLSKSCTFVFGSVITSIGVKVVAFPPKGVVTLGLVGGVVSVALTGSDVELFGCSALSIALAVTLPSGIGRVGVIVTRPLAPVVPEPMTLPSLSKSCTFVFGSVVTSTGVKVVAFPPKGVVTLGLVGGVVSVALTGSDVELLGCSALSIALAVTLPSGIGLVGVILTRPELSVVPVPMICPFLSNN